jgi:hypothetical protein
VIASLVWKEYREHRAIWLAMAVLAVGSLTIATQWQLPNGWKGGDQDAATAVIGGAFILAAMYGLVCGGMMFAGERETRGMWFLDTLPLGRGELWGIKLLIGMAFVLLYSVVIIATGVALGLVGHGAIHPVATVLIPLTALEAYVMGLCASTFCRTVLSAVALAALLPMPILGMCSGVVLAASATPQGMMGLAPVVLVFHGLVMLGALGLSLNYFYDRDFEKRFVLKPASRTYGSVAPKRQPRRWEVLLWLVLRQGGLLVGVMAVLGFFLGFGLPTVGAGLWPVATLFLGVACGTAVFAGEQAEGAFKFWGDQRLPVGWLWLRRSALWGGAGLLVAGLMLLAALLHVLAQDRGLPGDPVAILGRLLALPSSLAEPEEMIAFVVMWPAYGFALGQLCCLVWRKTAVAVVVALLTSAGSAAIWVPSLVGGGLHVVQVLGAPLLLLATCRVALWDWVTDRLQTRKSAVRLVGGVLLVSAWVALGLTYRVLEVPGGPEPFDRAGLMAHLNSPGQLEPGQDIHPAVTLAFPPVAAQGQDLVPKQPALPAPDRERLVGIAIDQGWEAAKNDRQFRQFENWLDQRMGEEWPAQLARGAHKEPGVLFDPRNETDQARKDAADCRKAGQLLAARALQLQSRGADEPALEALLTVLALSRHMRYQAPAYAYLEGLETERAALTALEHCLPRLGRRPELLRRVLDALRAHEEATAPVSGVLEAEYLTFWAGLGNKFHRGGVLNSEMEAQLMQVPWEAGRARRLTTAVFAGRRRLAESGAVVDPSDDRPLADWEPDPAGPSRERLAQLVASSWLGSIVPVTAPAQRAAQFGLCRARAARLQVALALYQSEHKEAAPSLDALVPGVLAELPQDPFSHEPFRYRVSKKDESIAWPRQLVGGGQEFVRRLPEGQGILWSTGPDGNDDGGTRQWDNAKGGPGRDVIFLAPAK